MKSTIILNIAATAFVTCFAGTQFVFAETLKISTFVPPKHAFNRMLTAWGEELSSKSNGELKVEIFPAGQLGPPPRQFDLVRSGGADIAVILHGAAPGRFPLSELAGLPLSAPSKGDDSSNRSLRLTELAPEYLTAEHDGTKILWMAVTPPLKIHAKGFDPSNLENLEGKRIRYTGKVWQKIVEILGASPVPVPPSQTADAMGKGVVDAATFPFEATMPFDLAPVTDYTLTPGIASVTFSVVMGNAAYARLSEPHKALVNETTGPARAAAFGSMWDAGEVHGRKYMEKGGVKVVQMSSSQINSLRGKLEKIVEASIQSVDETGMPGSAFYQAFTK
ncbi:MAG: TRAP transporter substrate-binding protein [Planktomarina sp.]|nr:TRAP transporter substrate-binding protein [Planktomarina sp.]